MIDPGDGLMQAFAILGGQVLEQAPVIGDRLQDRSRGAQAFDQTRYLVRILACGFFACHGRPFTNFQPHMIARINLAVAPDTDDGMKRALYDSAGASARRPSSGR
jgi:hypothetical protein